MKNVLSDAHAQEDKPRIPFVRYSFVVVDEFHMRKGDNTQTMNNLRGLPGQPRAIFISATPFERSISDMIGALSVMQEHWSIRGQTVNPSTGKKEEYMAWADTKHERNAATLEALDSWDVKKHGDVITHFGKGRRDYAHLAAEEKTKVDEALAVSRLILKTYMIRRTAASRWFSQPAVDIPPHEHVDINFRIPFAQYEDLMKLNRVAEGEVQGDLVKRLAKYAKNVEAREREGKTSHGPKPKTMDETKWMTAAHNGRIAATIPHFAKLMVQQHGKWNVELAADLVKCVDEGKPHNIISMLNPILATSPKIKGLLWLLDKVPKEKGVMFTWYPLTAAVIYAVSRRSL